MSARTFGDQTGSLTGTSLSELVERGSQPGHGSPGIWWVEAEAALPGRSLKGEG